MSLHKDVNGDNYVMIFCSTLNCPRLRNVPLKELIFGQE